MTREEILENLDRVEGTTTYILIFEHIEDQLLNSNYTKCVKSAKSGLI
jgi:hypothetical protein